MLVTGVGTQVEIYGVTFSFFFVHLFLLVGG